LQISAVAPPNVLNGQPLEIDAQPAEIEGHPLEFGPNEIAEEEGADGGFLLLDIEAEEEFDHDQAEAARVAAAEREKVPQLL